MPLIELHTLCTYVHAMRSYLPVLGPILRTDTAKVFAEEGIEPKHVEVRICSFELSDAEPNERNFLKIRGLISGSPTREVLIPVWSLRLGEAWQEFSTSTNIRWQNLASAWAFAPPGKWVKANEEALAERRAELVKAGLLLPD